MTIARAATMTARRSEVLSSVAAAFAAYGYHGIGMRQIAQALGLNQGTLYHYFQSKDHALLAVCLVGKEEALANAMAALAESKAFEPRLRILFERHLASLDRAGDFIQVYVNQRQLLTPDLAATLDEGWAQTRGLLRQLFVDAIARGELEADIDPRNATRLLLGIYRTANMLHGIGRRDELRDFFELAMRTVLNGLAPARRQQRFPAA